IGSATSAPYAATWSSVGAGNYVLTAKATDNRGAVTTSSPVSVSVNANSLPTVSLTSPASGTSYLSPATIALAASANDADGTITRVDFYQGATLIGSSTSPPYSFSWNNVAAGNYTLTARATDNQGAVTTSAPITVSVAGPSLSITSPIDNAAIDGDWITVSGAIQAPLNSGVTVNGVVAAVDGGGHFYANGVQLSPGSNTVTAKLTTLGGQVTTQSITVTSGGPAPVKISATPTDGLAPLTVVFEIAPRSGVVIQKVEFDLDANGSFEQTLVAEPWTTTATYSGVG